MANNSIGRAAVSLLWRLSFLGAGAAAGLWLVLSPDTALELLATAVLVLTAVVGLVWFAGYRTARRWQAAVDVYAERQLARTREDSPSPSPLVAGTSEDDFFKEEVTC